MKASRIRKRACRAGEVEALKKEEWANSLGSHKAASGRGETDCIRIIQQSFLLIEITIAQASSLEAVTPEALVVPGISTAKACRAVLKGPLASGFSS